MSRRSRISLNHVTIGCDGRPFQDIIDTQIDTTQETYPYSRNMTRGNIAISSSESVRVELQKDIRYRNTGCLRFLDICILNCCFDSQDRFKAEFDSYFDSFEYRNQNSQTRLLVFVVVSLEQKDEVREFIRLYIEENIEQNKINELVHFKCIASSKAEKNKIIIQDEVKHQVALFALDNPIVCLNQLPFEQNAVLQAKRSEEETVLLETFENLQAKIDEKGLEVILPEMKLFFNCFFRCVKERNIDFLQSPLYPEIFSHLYQMIGHTMDQKYIHTAEYTAQQWLCILNYKDKQELMPYYIEALYAISKAYTETMPNSMSGLALLQQCALLSPEPIYKVEFLNCLIGFMDGSPTAKAVDLNERIKELTTQVAQHKDYIRSIEALNKQRDHFFNPQSVSGLVKRCLTLFGPKPNPKQEAATSANASPSESGASPP